MMWRLAVLTVRAHIGSYFAPAAVMTAGTALLTAFASLLETGLETGRSAGFLIMLPAILGGWTVAIVAFGVVSTVSLTIQHREQELALLRSIAATPRQIRQNVVLETAIVALPAVAAGLLPGIALGSVVLGRLVGGGLVSAPTALSAGWLCVAIGAGTSLSAAVGAALISSGRAASIPPVRALSEASPSARPLARARAVSGLGLLAVGLSLAAATLFMADGPLLSSTAGPAGVAVAVGLALLSPLAVTPVRWLSNARLGATTRLAARNAHVRAGHSAGVASPLILLVGIAAGTLYMQSTEDSVHRGPAVAGDVSAQLAPVNYLIVIMIIGFSAIVVINTLVAATRRRRREFGLLRLSAATRGQVLKMVAIEAVVTAGIAVVLGTLAAAATTVPYSMVKTGSPIASGPAWMYLAVVGGAFLLVMLATIPTTMGALRVRPVDALSAA
ncbi:putative ABC transport system permease protein [Streptosporangium album]|uniref:Putative ABC transport system permease protein n=1 Tax=Streptosporangium album TaxID=47479 RepID=A0A7W7W6Y8_9ACTN|nr:FtsX-like permease family protein [Streptosporangium album]MBB4936747.1 putative ABC transport system permease protein [Streptosporangium album]